MHQSVDVGLLSAKPARIRSIMKVSKDRGATDLLAVIARYDECNVTVRDCVSTYVVVVNHCFTSLFGTKGLLSDIII